MPQILTRSFFILMMLFGLTAAQSFAPGIKAGFDLASLRGDDVDVDQSQFGGFTGGFFFRMNFSKFIGIQPEILYAQKGIKFEVDDFSWHTRLHYFEVPVQLMLSIPAGSIFSPYISVGPYAGALIEARQRTFVDYEELSKETITSHFVRGDFGISAGFGSAFDTDAGDFILDFRFNVGLSNIYDDESDCKNLTFAMTIGYAFKRPALVGHRSGTVQKADASYLKFIGNIDGITVEVDGGPRFEVKSADTNYETTPGKHVVKAFRGNQIIMHREIYIGNHETKEVSIP